MANETWYDRDIATICRRVDELTKENEELKQELAEVVAEFDFSQDKVREAIRKADSLYTHQGLTLEDYYVIVDTLADAEI